MALHLGKGHCAEWGEMNEMPVSSVVSCARFPGQLVPTTLLGSHCFHEIPSEGPKKKRETNKFQMME